MNKNKFNIQDITSILDLASKLNKTCSFTIENILGKNTYKIDMNNWHILVANNKFFYNEKMCCIYIYIYILVILSQ